MATEPPEGELSSAPPPTPDETDSAFVGALREAGLLGEMTDSLLMVLMEAVPPGGDDDARRLNLLELYFAGGKSLDVGHRRRETDRFFLYDAKQPESARQLTHRLAELMPEVGDVALERIGTDDGPLVLRAGDHFSAVTDDYEEDDEELDTGQIDLSELEHETTITVRGLVNALNVLLDRHDVRERLVPLPCDGEREGYVATGVTEAMLLCRAGCLEEDDPELLMEFCAW